MFNISVLMNNGNMSLICKLVSSLSTYDYITDYKQITVNSDYLPGIAQSPCCVSLFLCSFAPAVNYMTQEIIQNWSISNSFFSCIHLKIQLPMWIPSFWSDSWNFLSLFCDHVAFLSWLTSTISVLCMWQHLNYYHKLWFVSINERKVNKTLSLG